MGTKYRDKYDLFPWHYHETSTPCPDCETPLTKVDDSTMFVCVDGHGPYFLV